MYKILAVTTASCIIALTYTVSKQSEEIKLLHEDVKVIKQFITQTNEQVTYTAKDKECLSKNIYYEAGIESLNGKYAVGQVTMNRLKSGFWGNNICKVVYAKAQFSWTKHHRKLKEPSGRGWDDSVKVAASLLNGTRVNSLKTSLFYHAHYTKPSWVLDTAYIQRVGQHMFYTIGKGNTIVFNG